MLFPTVLTVAMLVGVGAESKDVAGAKDHPMVGRYTGSEITFYSTRAFDTTKFMQAPVDDATVSAAMSGPPGGPAFVQAEGRLTQIRYDAPAGRSSLEILRNLQAGLAAKGFQTVFACDTADCFTGRQRDPYLLGWILDSAQQNGRYTEQARYLLDRLDRPEGAITVALLVGEAGSKATVFVKVVEAKPMETGKVTFVDADAMTKALDAGGHVALYGILFDFDKDTLRLESKPTLDEIAKLLRSNPSLKLVVAGHTDNQGSFDYNIELSRHRAASVVTALTGTYGVARDRLVPFGAGMAAPVASNATEEGRAKNRRVELVAR